MGQSPAIQFRQQVKFVPLKLPEKDKIYENSLRFI